MEGENVSQLTAVSVRPSFPCDLPDRHARRLLLRNRRCCSFSPPVAWPGCSLLVLPRTVLASSICLVCFSYWIYFLVIFIFKIRKPNLSSFSASKHSRPIHLHVQVIRSSSLGPHLNCFHSPTFLFPHSQPICNILFLSVHVSVQIDPSFASLYYEVS